MISGVVGTSVLRQKAAQYSIRNIAGAPVETQLAIFQETLVDLELYFDTGDLDKLNERSLGIIRDDILEIIKGFRRLGSGFLLGYVSSLDGILENLRDARDSIQNAIHFFRQGKKEKFYQKLRTARERLAEVLRLFRPVRQ